MVSFPRIPWVRLRTRQPRTRAPSARKNGRMRTKRQMKSGDEGATERASQREIESQSAVPEAVKKKSKSVMNEYMLARTGMHTG